MPSRRKKRAATARVTRSAGVEPVIPPTTLPREKRSRLPTSKGNEYILNSPRLRASFATSDKNSTSTSTAVPAATPEASPHRDTPPSPVIVNDNVAGNTDVSRSSLNAQTRDVKSQIDRLLDVVSKLSDKVDRQSKAIRYLSKASSSVTDTQGSR